MADNDNERRGMAEWRAYQAAQNSPDDSAETPQEPIEQPIEQPVQLTGEEESTASVPDASADVSESTSETPEPRQRLTINEMRQQAAEALDKTISKAAAALEEKGQQAAQAFAAGRENATEALKNLKEGAESTIAALKARVLEELKTEREGAEYNLVLAKVLAEDAARQLGEKLKKVEPHMAFGALWFGLHALVYGGATVLKVESLIPAGGNMVDGLKAYLDNLDTVTAAAPSLAAVFTGMSSVSAKLSTVESMRNNKPDQEGSKT